MAEAALDPATAAAAATAFGLGAPTGPVRSAVRGAMGEVFRLETAAGVVALKRLFGWNLATGAEAEAAASNRARSAGVAVPRELRSADGRLVVVAGGERFRAYEWVDLAEPVALPAPRRVANAVGRIAARLHLTAPTADGEVDGWYTTAPGEERWRALLAAAHGCSWSAPMSALVPDLVLLADVVSGSLPWQRLRICHRDLDPSNVLPSRHGRLVVLDWENAGPLDIDQELGALLLSWCVAGGEVSARAVRALLAGYRAAGGEPAPVSRYAFGCASAVWLNFLAVQAAAALDPAGEPAHRRFGETAVTRMLAAPLTVGTLDAVVRVAAA